MPSYTGPVEDLQFVLHEVLKISEQDVPGYDELDAEFTGAILGEAAKISSEVIAPLNTVGDQEGVTMENGVVRTPTGFKEAFDQLREGRLDRARLRPRVRRPRHALPDAGGHRRDVLGRQPGLHDVPGPDPRRLFRHPRPRHG